MFSFEVFYSYDYPELELEPGFYIRQVFPGGDLGEPIGTFASRGDAETAADLELAEYTPDFDEPGEQPHFS